MTYPESVVGLDRRQMLKVLAIAGFAEFPVLAAGKNLRGVAINHVSYASSDYKNSAIFTAMFLDFKSRMKTAISSTSGPEMR